MVEIETKIDEIDLKDAEEALRKIGAKFVEKKLFKRWVFSLPEKSGEDRFVRLRTDGKTSTLTYKRRFGDGLANTEEIETEVKNFDAVAKILSSLILEPLYQENRRTLYSFGDVEISIDEWPKLPPIMEIEADSEAKVRDALNKLNIKGKELGNIGWEKVYAMHGMDLRSFKILKFDDKEEKYD